jgi:hypothetical protein
MDFSNKGTSAADADLAAHRGFEAHSALRNRPFKKQPTIQIQKGKVAREGEDAVNDNAESSSVVD